MALLDVQKSFDSVNHEMPCEKIRLAGIEPDWCISYLEARKQMVCVDESYSSSETIKCGVSQGKVLGPWCYLMYINDIASSVSCKLLMYVDDTVLLVSDKNINTVSVQLGNEVTNSYNWLVNNKLAMHMGKTECIVYISKGFFYKVSYPQCGRFESGEIFGIGHGYEPIKSSNSHVHCQKSSRKVEIYVQASKLVG